MPLPILLVVTGPPGSGKTTLALEIATAMGCPAVIRDVIKQGMVLGVPDFDPEGDDPFNYPTLSAFFGVLNVLVRAGVTAVAEAAFQDRLWRPNLEPLREFARIRIIECSVDAEVARDRIARRAGEVHHRAAHADHGLLKTLATDPGSGEGFGWISLDLPRLVVDTTTSDFRPSLKDIVDFAVP